MANVKFFLDTGALVALSGLECLDLKSFKNRVEATNSELSVTHVQIDESTEHLKFAEKVQNKHGKRVRNYQEKIDSALRKLKERGINVQLT